MCTVHATILNRGLKSLWFLCLREVENKGRPHNGHLHWAQTQSYGPA